jgi:hypothetical protein
VKATTIEHTANISDVRITLRQAPRPYIDILAADLALSGPEHPIIITHSGELIDGLRRLRAAERLGWTTIPVVQVSTVDAALPLIALQMHGKGAEPHSWTSLAEVDAMLLTLPRISPVGDSRRVQARALFCDPSRLAKVRNLWRHATGRPGHKNGLPSRELRAEAQRVLAILDSGVPYKPIWEQWLDFRDSHLGEPDTSPSGEDEALLAEGIPDPKLRTQHAVLRRHAWIRKLAGEGMTSYQIGDRLGMRPNLVRYWAKKLGVNLKADKAVGRGQINRTVDVDRVMATMVADLDAMTWAISTVDDNIATLDRARAAAWVGDLSAFTTRLRRLNGHIRDHLREEGQESGN